MKRAGPKKRRRGKRRPPRAVQGVLFRIAHLPLGPPTPPRPIEVFRL